jgi:1,4-alpha-glucan branching enzyme
MALASKKQQQPNVIHGASLLTDQDIYLFKEGSHFRLYEKLGSHLTVHEGVKGTHFAVWAPNAEKVSVIGDFNGWNANSHPLEARWDSSGIWEGFIPNIGNGTIYKYSILSKNKHLKLEKGDPFAFKWETPPHTASIVWDLSYQRNSGNWNKIRGMHNSLDSPINIYEMHFASWRRVPEENNRPLTYREMAMHLPVYLKEMGFTHVEFLPTMEHPFCGSWGYQKVGYFAASSRYGDPQDFMFLIDTLHQNEIGVILDWVPSHFPSDAHGLAYYDGTHLYEHEDPRLGFHPDWKSYIFNYGRNEVRAFLISSAMFWFDKYQVDGLRVDAVASMIYLDYSRKEGEWIPNIYGGKENLSAITFLQTLNHVIYEKFPYVQMIAEESTAWTGVTRPTFHGGLGFGMKWNMGWMHDTLVYMSRDPIHRKYHHNDLTFSLLYAFSENFALALSHDEVVHGKGSLIAKLPGDEWQKFANLRLLFGYQYGHPGKKLLFMGSEFGQYSEWNHSQSLEWHVLHYPCHQGLQRWVQDLNKTVKEFPSLHQVDFSWEGFEWIESHDWENSILSFMRYDKSKSECTLVVCNFTPMPRHHYRIGVPRSGIWKEVLNSDAKEYWGSGIGNYGQAQTENYGYHGKPYSLSLTLPPLGILFFHFRS